MHTFNFQTEPVRVLFGSGRLAEVKAEAEALDGTRTMILAGKLQAELARKTADLLGELCAGIHTGAVPHVPYPVVLAAVEEARRVNANLLIALGGGSTIGLAKGIALETDLPILAIPTTYAGSEMTRIWGISRDGRKTTGRDLRVKPKTVIYDPELLVTLPASVSLTSGINAMAHAVEALYAEKSDPVTRLMAAESIRQLAGSLAAVVREPGDLQARSDSLLGAWLAAAVLDRVGMALHHKLCHTLGGSFDMPHAETHTVILPYVVRYNAPAITGALAIMARGLACAVDDVPGAIQDIARENGGPVSLQELGFQREDLLPAAQLAAHLPYYNPRPVSVESILALLQHAYGGERP